MNVFFVFFNGGKTKFNHEKKNHTGLGGSEL